MNTVGRSVETSDDGRQCLTVQARNRNDVLICGAHAFSEVAVRSSDRWTMGSPAMNSPMMNISDMTIPHWETRITPFVDSGRNGQRDQLWWTARLRNRQFKTLPGIRTTVDLAGERLREGRSCSFAASLVLFVERPEEQYVVQNRLVAHE